MKKKLVAALLVLALLITAHLIPIYQRTGYLDKGSGNLCIGYTAPNVYSKRVIVNGFKVPQYFKSDSRAANGSGLDCAEPVKIRYFLI